MGGASELASIFAAAQITADGISSARPGRRTAPGQRHRALAVFGNLVGFVHTYLSARLTTVAAVISRPTVTRNSCVIRARRSAGVARSRRLAL